MAEKESRASLTTLLDQFDGATFWRIGRWCAAAIAAVSLVLLIGNSDMGVRRIALAFSNIQGLPPAQPRENNEVVRLSEVLRLLTSDQNRLLARLEKLERNLADLTGSIAQSSMPPRGAENITPPPAESGTPPQTLPPSVAATSIPPTGPSAPAQQPPVLAPAQDALPADTPGTTKIDFGVDLGSAPTVEGLRSLWTSAKRKHATLFEGLRPIMTIRENSRPGSVELRLVAGPVPSAALAARLCVAIIATGSVCQPAVFDGQRLAMR